MHQTRKPVILVGRVPENTQTFEDKVRGKTITNEKEATFPSPRGGGCSLRQRSNENKKHNVGQGETEKK